MIIQPESLTLTSPTTLEWCEKTYDCRTGRGGIRTKKVEGDGATPIGIFPIRQVLYRPDRIRPFACDLQTVSLTPVDGWCDDPTDPHYNRLIRTPYPTSHEVLWREDHVYDIILVVGYNDKPVVSPKGSAIFIHIMNESQTPTDGCISMARADLIDLLGEITPTTQLVVPEHLENCISPIKSQSFVEKIT
jgi:L,D-peptidoglycan transpeptidase YkuD (ErfK/YbiS/YcfS/YnhG family)